MGKTFGVKCQHKWDRNHELDYEYCRHCKMVKLEKWHTKIIKNAKSIGTLAQIQESNGN